MGKFIEENNIVEEVNKSGPLLYAAFRTMLANTKDMVFVKDANLVYIAASIPFVEMVGKEKVDEIINRTDSEIFEDKTLAERYVADDRKLLAEGRNQVDYIEPITDDNGQARYGSTSKYILNDEDGNVIGILGITRDITREYIARRHYQQELKYLFELPSDTYAVSYIDIDGWRIISQRRQFINEGTMEPCYTVENLLEIALDAIVDKECPAAEFYRNFDPVQLNSIYESGRSNLAFRYQRRLSDGTIRWVHTEFRFMVDVESGHLCAMLSGKDIDAQKQEEQKLMEAATLDRMTNLLNRQTTMEYIRQTLQDDANYHHALFIVDVDNFKLLNDSLGHQTGDEFLVALAAVLKDSFRETDIVGRVGGDEFFALMRNISGVSAVNRKIKELQKAINGVCEEYSSVSLSGSIGISLYPDNGRTLEELYGEADSALYQAKRNGKNRFAFATV